MPMSKARMRERKKQDRSVKPMSNLNCNSDVKPNTATPVKPNLDELRAVIRKIERGVYNSPEADVQPEIPLYNPAIHRAGDKVLVKRGNRLVVAVIPKMDAEGCIIPEYE